MIVQTVTLSQAVGNGTTAVTPSVLTNRSFTRTTVTFHIEGLQALTTAEIQGRSSSTASWVGLTPTPTILAGGNGIYTVPLCNEYRVSIDNTGELNVATMTIYMGN